MDEQPHVKVTISRIGRVRQEAIGYQWGACKVATAAVQHAFRGAQVSEVEKPELYHTIEGEQAQEGTLENL